MAVPSTIVELKFSLGSILDIFSIKYNEIYKKVTGKGWFYGK